MPTATKDRKSGKEEMVSFTWVNHAKAYYKEFALWAQFSEEDKKRLGAMLQNVQENRNFEEAMAFWKEMNIAWIRKSGTLPEERKQGFEHDVQDAKTEDEAATASRRMLFHHASHYKYQFAGMLEDKYKGTMKIDIMHVDEGFDPARLHDESTFSALSDSPLKAIASKYPEFLFIDKNDMTIKLNLLQASLKIEEDLKAAIAEGKDRNADNGAYQNLVQWRHQIRKLLEDAMKGVGRKKSGLIDSGIRYTPINFFNAMNDAESMYESNDYLDRSREWAWDFLYLLSLKAYTGRLFKNEQEKEGAENGNKEKTIEPPPFQFNKAEKGSVEQPGETGQEASSEPIDMAKMNQDITAMPPPPPLERESRRRRIFQRLKSIKAYTERLFKDRQEKGETENVDNEKATEPPPFQFNKAEKGSVEQPGETGQEASSEPIDMAKVNQDITAMPPPPPPETEYRMHSMFQKLRFK